MLGDVRASEEWGEGGHAAQGKAGEAGEADQAPGGDGESKGADIPSSQIHTSSAVVPVVSLSRTARHPFRSLTRSGLKTREEECVSFPSDLLLSDNFHKRRWIGIGDRRLKNVGLLMEWLLPPLLPPPQGGGSQGEEGEGEGKGEGEAGFPAGNGNGAGGGEGGGEGSTERRKLVLVSLAEGETLRRLIHVRRARQLGARGALHSTVVECTSVEGKAAATISNDDESNTTTNEVVSFSSDAVGASVGASGASSERSTATTDGLCWLDTHMPEIALRSATGRILDTSSEGDFTDFTALAALEGKAGGRGAGGRGAGRQTEADGSVVITAVGCGRGSRGGSSAAEALQELKEHPMFTAVQCARFFNGEMYFTPAELSMLRLALRGTHKAVRKDFFEECMRVRRRERALWADTPVARLFADPGEWRTTATKSEVP